MSSDCLAHLQLLLHLRLTLVLLEPNSKAPLVKWINGWCPTATNLRRWASVSAINWRLRCGEHLPIIDCDSEDAYLDFVAIHRLPPDCPLVETDHSYDIWVRPDFAQLTDDVSAYGFPGTSNVQEPSFQEAWNSVILESDSAKLLPRLRDQLIVLGEPAQQLRQALDNNGHHADKIADLAKQTLQGGRHAP